MLPQEPERVDGRKLRARRTRGAIVAAALELIEEGDVAPTAQALAERAGVAVRSIGQHFSSREDLVLAAVEEHAARLAGMRVVIDSDLPWGQRLEAFVGARARELDASAAMRRAGAVHETRSEVVARAVKAAARARRAEVTRVFEVELSALAPAARRTSSDALDAATSGRAWDGMRKDAGLSLAQAKAAMAKLITSLLTRD